MRDVPSSDVDVEAEVAATTSPDGDGNGEGLVDKESPHIHSLGSYLRRKDKKGVTTNDMSVDLLCAGIKILEGTVFSLSKYLTADTATMLSSSQGGGG